MEQLEYYESILLVLNIHKINIHKLLSKFPNLKTDIFDMFKLYNDIYKQITNEHIRHFILNAFDKILVQYKFKEFYDHYTTDLIKIEFQYPIETVNIIEKILNKNNYNLEQIQIETTYYTTTLQYIITGVTLDNIEKAYCDKYYDRKLQSHAHIFYKNLLTNRNDHIINIRKNIVRDNNLIDEILTHVSNLYPELSIFTGEHVIRIINPNLNNILFENNQVRIPATTMINYNVIIDWFIRNGYCDSIDSYNDASGILTINNIPHQPKNANG